MDIVVSHLWKSYGEKTVFAGFSCQIPRGSRCAVLAPSGSGKTTLLRLLLGLEAPDAGTITGVPAECSAVFQEDRLIPKRSALENIRMAAPEAGAIAGEILGRLGLDAAAQSQRACTLSGGQARRAALARALARQSGLLALDEPFSGLDDDARRRAAGTVLRYLRGRTLLLITHRPEDLELLEITRQINI